MRYTAFCCSPKGTIKIKVESLKLNWHQYFESESRLNLKLNWRQYFESQSWLTFWSWSLCDEDLLQLGAKEGGRECVLSPTSYQTVIDKLEEGDSQSRAAQKLHNHVNTQYLEIFINFSPSCWHIYIGVRLIGKAGEANVHLSCVHRTY